MDYREFGNRIRIERHKQRLTQDRLAEQVGVSTSFMGNVERGTRVASLETFIHICNALQMPPQELLRGYVRDFSLPEIEPCSDRQREQVGQLLRIAQEVLLQYDTDKTTDSTGKDMSVTDS